MSNKPLQQNCATCRYRTVSILIEPCQSCKRSLVPFGQGDHWRKRGWWQSRLVLAILAALVAVAVATAAVLIGWTTASAAGPSTDPVELAARQEEVHAAAELLRELGVDEDDQAIQALSAEWWRCQARLYPRYTEEEVVMLAKLMWGEARGIESKTEVACVGWAVCNRVDDQPEPVTVRYVITVPNRFCYSESFPVREDLLWLARDVLERWTMESLGCPCAGRVLPSDYRWFVGRDGRNRFRNAYKGGEQWDYSLPSPYES